MSERLYEEGRPSIPADVRRAVEVESGHSCAVNRCDEHTYLEIHHINQDREDNRVENLILLCDKHHKMAHAGVIDRKALLEHKALLSQNYQRALLERVERLEQLLAQAPKPEGAEAESNSLPPVADPGLPIKIVSGRATLMARTLEQLALAKFEKDRGIYLERQPSLKKGTAELQFDALRQDDNLPADLIVEVRWLRKRYLDAPVWVQQVDSASSLYELITGRKAQGVLIFIVPKASMKQISELYYTSSALQQSERKPEVVLYSYDDLGFDPGPLSVALFSSNVKPAGPVDEG